MTAHKNSKKYHNRQLLIARIQELDQRFRSRGMTRSFIYKHIIFPHFFISYMTYYRYLKVSISDEIKEKLAHTNIVDYALLLRALEPDRRPTQPSLPGTEQDIRAFLRSGQKH